MCQIASSLLSSLVCFDTYQNCIAEIATQYCDTILRHIITLQCHTLSHSSVTCCHIPVSHIITLQCYTLSHSSVTRCHTPVPHIVTLQCHTLSHSSATRCHTPVSHIVTLQTRVPVSVRHVAIGESNQELAKQNLYIFANLAKSNK